MSKLPMTCAAFAAILPMTAVLAAPDAQFDCDRPQFRHSVVILDHRPVDSLAGVVCHDDFPLDPLHHQRHRVAAT